MAYDTENLVIIVILVGLSTVYLYLLLSPSQARPSVSTAFGRNNVVITKDSQESFLALMRQVRGEGGGGGGYTGGEFNFVTDDVYGNSTGGGGGGGREGEYEWGVGKKEDDFFLDSYNTGLGGGMKEEVQEEEGHYEPLIPSTNYLCSEDWITIRSEMNYRYLWMHGTEEFWMAASATIDTPLHRKTFQLHPLHHSCSQSEGGGGGGGGGGGWVVMREGDSPFFIHMVHPNQTEHGYHDREAWVVKLGTSNITEAFADPSYHFLVEKEDERYLATGHASGWDLYRPANREMSAMIHYTIIQQDEINASIKKEMEEDVKDKQANDELIARIASLPISTTEKRVISFGLYGSKEKYTTGAIRNVELAKVYFPGWICRFYITSDVPQPVVEELRRLGAEILPIPEGKDPTVDRYIIRDSDSRLNARDRLAVEEWIRSGYAVHIQRDHVNHCIVMNGGMWGGVKDAVPDMNELVEAWNSRNEYMADLHFLEQQVWPLVKHKQLSHDSYCCDRFPHCRPYPTRRYFNYQHVGQVFDEFDQPRLTDIDGFIRGVPTPSSCRKKAEWIYG
eukprot:scaffold398_cov177-Ochromonas_danica.AAC.19